MARKARVIAELLYSGYHRPMETKTIQVRGRGTVTLPARIRERYDLSDGDPLTLVDLDGAILLTPKLSIAEKLSAEIEYLRTQAGMSMDELLDGLREQRARYHAERLGDG
jgi:AbrB family looped-hinge helix DNA binding protein